MTKIDLPRDAELSDEIKAVLALLPPVNVFRMAANAPKAAIPLIGMVRALMTEGSFDARLREIAILRVAWVTRASYEWTQHAVLAKQVGVTEDQISAIAVMGPVTRLGPEANLICRAADEISLAVRISDEALAQLLERYGRALTTEIIICISFYNMLSRFLESTRVEIEPKLAISPDNVIIPR